MSTGSSLERLTYYDGPLVWIDCEMTGLDYKKDRILEIAVSGLGPDMDQIFVRLSLSLCLQIVITNGNLDMVDDGLDFVIRTEQSALDKFESFPTLRV
jgi:oligoribonuclease